MRSHPCTLALCFTLASAASAPAQPDVKAPLDPAHVVSQFRKAYHKRPFVESLDITVRTASETRRESAVVRANIKGELRLELGDLIMWTEAPPANRLIAVHRLNAGTYFEAPLEGLDRAASLSRVLPPLPIPQIALVLQPPDAASSLWTVSPLATAPHWDTATAARRANKPAVVLAGTCEHAGVRVAGVGDPPQLVFADTKSTRDDLTTTISADITRLDEPVGKLEADLRGRTRVESLTDLRPQTPDLRPGLAMPDLIAQPVEPAAADARASLSLLPAGKPCVLLIFDAAQSQAVDPRAAEAVAAAKRAAVTFRTLAACGITDRGSREKATTLMRRHAGAAAYISYSPPTTLWRFAPSSGAPAVAVVLDATALVTAIIPTDTPDFANSLHAALESLPKR